MHFLILQEILLLHFLNQKYIPFELSMFRYQGNDGVVCKRRRYNGNGDLCPESREEEAVCVGTLFERTARTY